MKTKIIAFAVAGIIAGGSIWFAGFKFGQKYQRVVTSAQVHEHEWGNWEGPKEEDAKPEATVKEVRYLQFRSCTNCGLSEFRVVTEIK